MQVSGHDGGTGASPISSIKHAGGPVEMGVAETHQALVRNELRHRVVLRADGGLRNGRDVLLLAALGADEFGFGTAAMIATGCIMARVCHTNNCPVGVASQKEELRARFPGTPADVVRFFEFVAEEVRAELARLGLRRFDEVVGQAHLLKQRNVPLAKTEGLDLSFITTFAGETAEASSERIAQEVHDNGRVLDDDLLDDREVTQAIESGGSVERSLSITNLQRAAFARVSGRIAKRWGDRGFPGKIALNCMGSGGQSFCAFLTGGMDVTVTGEANDYVCKGMAGGTVTIRPPGNAGFDPAHSSIVGNTCLYGATGGKLFVHGRAGERFAVRNSMAEAVCEGAGDHCCEYMTGGTVVVLGSVGRNVAAGMTGGLGYFYDPEDTLCAKVNPEIVVVQRIASEAGEELLKGLIEEHYERTGSAKAKGILDNWREEIGVFWQLVPPSEKSTPQATADVPLESIDSASVYA
jgi:glutamate synthase (ferredoxin)